MSQVNTKFKKIKSNQVSAIAGGRCYWSRQL